MLSGKLLLCVVLIAAWHDDAWCLPSGLRLLPARIADENDHNVYSTKVVVEVPTKVREGVPPPLCAARCSSPPYGPVCAFDATGTARTFATLCELETVSCRESTYYAITSLGEC